MSDLILGFTMSGDQASMKLNQGTGCSGTRTVVKITSSIL